MSMHDETLKLVTNLGRAGIEGMPKAQIEERVQSALKSLRGDSGQGGLSALLELVELNLPNLK